VRLLLSSSPTLPPISTADRVILSDRSRQSAASAMALELSGSRTAVDRRFRPKRQHRSDSRYYGRSRRCFGPEWPANRHSQDDPPGAMAVQTHRSTSLTVTGSLLINADVRKVARQRSTAAGRC
jgi:hypothetical protein